MLFDSSWKKILFLRGEVIKNSVRNFRYLSSFTVTAPETETISLNSHSGVRLNFDLATAKCALLRSKISDGASVLGVLGLLGILVITPCKALGPKASCFVTEIFGVIFESVQPLWICRSPPWFLLSVLSALLTHCCLLLLGPLPYCPFSKRNFLSTKPIALLASFTSFQHWRMKTLHGYTMSFIPWPQIAFPKSPPPHSWAPVTLNFLLWWILLSPSGSCCPLTVVHAVSSACNAFLPISTWWHLANKCVSFLLWRLTNHPYSPWLTHTLPLHPYPYSSVHVWLLFITSYFVPHIRLNLLDGKASPRTCLKA